MMADTLIKIELPDTERGMAPAEIARFDVLQRRLARPDLKTTKRDAALTELRALEESPKEHADKAWREQSLAETIRLAIERGEAVEDRGRGAVRMKTRDGLQSALEAKDGLSKEQHETGLMFRDAWESRSGDVGSQMGNEGGGGGHHNDSYVFNRFTRAKKLQKLGEIERLVAMTCKDEPSCLQMLRAVAGDGHCLSSFGRGRTYERHLKAFKRALDVAGGDEAHTPC